MIPNFPARLSGILTEKNLTKTALAKAVGVKQQTVSEWTKGDCLPSLETFRAICEVLQVSSDYLLGLHN